MNMFAWLGLGFLAYVSGFSIRHFWYDKQDVPKDKQLQFTGMCFAVCVVIFAMLNFWVLKKPHLDWAFVGVSSLVATFVFYYGISTDTRNNMNLPD